MFSVQLQEAGKKYLREWIFSGFTGTFTQGDYVAVTGPNGSGKSTLLQIISGAVSPFAGSVHHYSGDQRLETGSVYRHVSIAAPYLVLIEDFSWEELVTFQGQLKPYKKGLKTEDVIQLSGLGPHRHKPIRYFSSGMKQRARLTLAFTSDTSMLLLDEPLQNLDSSGVHWYRNMISDFLGKRLCFVASNHLEQEYFFCEKQVSILDFKSKSL